MHNPTLIKTFWAGAAIAARRLVKFGSDDNNVIQAAAATDAVLAVANNLGAASGERVDVVMDGIAEVEYGGTVTRGDPLTSDSSGRAVTAAPATGTNNRIIGFALCSGVVGDIGCVRVNPCVMQG